MRNEIALPATTSKSWLWRLMLGACVTLLLASSGLNVLASGEDSSRGFIPCTVPSAGYPTIQSALDDLCLEVVLAAGDYNEFLTIDEGVRIIGPSDFSARILGLVTVDTSNVVSFRFVTIEPAELPSEIFGDDFESGDTNAWS